MGPPRRRPYGEGVSARPPVEGWVNGSDLSVGPVDRLRSALVVVVLVVGLAGVAVFVVVIVAEQVGDVDAVELLEPLGSIRGELVVRVRGPGEPVTRHPDVRS